MYVNKSFRLVKDKLDKEFNERQWTYTVEFKFVFNQRIINQITITDHTWKKKGREMITQELILKMLSKINGGNLKPIKCKSIREPYQWKAFYQDKPYQLFFWFKDGTTDHLWVRNCYRID